MPLHSKPPHHVHHVQVGLIYASGLFVHSMRWLIVCSSLLTIVPLLNASEQLVPQSVVRARLLALMYDGQTIPGTQKELELNEPSWVEVKTFDPNSAKRVLNEKLDPFNSLTSHFWGSQSKEFDIVLDLGRICKVERIEVTQGEPAGQANTLAHLHVYGSTRLPEQTWDHSFGQFTAEPGSSPPRIVAKAGWKPARFLKLSVLSTAPLSSIGSVKIFGSESVEASNATQQLEEPPENAFRVELGTAGGLTPEKSPELIGGLGVWREPFFELEVPSGAPKYQLWALAKPLPDASAEARIHGKSKFVQSIKSGWTYLGATEIGKITVEMVSNPINSVLWDELVLIPEGGPRPDRFFTDALNRFSLLNPLKGFAQRLLAEQPEISDEEFADLVARHYGFPETPAEPAPVIDEHGNPLWKGKPFFSRSIFHFNPRNPVVARTAVNTSWHNPEASDPRTDYAMVVSYHGLWRDYDSVARMLFALRDKDHPFIHYICDEPSNVGVTARELRRLNTLVKRLDPTRPTFINVCPNQVASVNVVSIPDVAGVDVYPIPAGRIRDIGYAIDRLRVASSARPYIFIPQFFSWEAYGRVNARFPTADEVWVMACIALARNARGLWFYEFPAPFMHSKTSVADLYPEQWEAFVKLMETLSSFNSELTGAEVDSESLEVQGDFPKDLHWRLAVAADRSTGVFIVANSADKSQTLTVDLRKSQLSDAIWSFYNGRGFSGLETAEPGVVKIKLEPMGSAFLKVQSSQFAGLPVLQPLQAVAQISNQLEAQSDRPKATLVLSDGGHAFACDLLDSWRSANRPESATIVASGKGLTLKVSTRFPKGVESRVAERDGEVWTDPSIELFLAKAENQIRYIQFVVNTANVVADLMVDRSKDPSKDLTFDSGFTSEASAGLESADYTIFMPWQTLKDHLGVGPGDVLRMNVASASSGWDWAGLSGVGYHQPESFGDVVLKSGTP